jgi:phosphinothricin acetyltransferase
MIRPVASEDAPAIAKIYAHYVEESVVTFDMEAPDVTAWREKIAGLAAAGLPFIVAEEQGSIAGYAYVAPYRAKPGYRFTGEDSIYLAPGFTGKGLGRALLTALLEECAATPVRQLVAVIADSGDPSSSILHERCGFTPAGRLREVGFKHGRRIDTIFLQCSIP